MTLFSIDGGLRMARTMRTVDATKLSGKKTPAVTRTEPNAPTTDATEKSTLVSTTETGGVRSKKGAKGKVARIARRSLDDMLLASLSN